MNDVRYRVEVEEKPMDYDRADAAYDAAVDAREAQVRLHLTPLVDAEIERVVALDERIVDQGYQAPHPWTWHRHLLWVWNSEDESAVREELEELFRDDAEESARDDAYDNTPCCRAYDCPCGGYSGGWAGPR